MADPPLAALLRQRLVELTGQVRVAEGLVRDDQPGGVHDLRVALRRTRSLLTSFRRELGQDTASLREQLRWAGGELGQLRDLEVVHDRLQRLLDEQSVELVLGGVQRRVDDFARDGRRAAAPAVTSLLATPAWAELLDELDRFSAGDDAAPSRSDARKRLRREWRRLRRRADHAAEVAGEGGMDDGALHEVRKAAKRARYAAETLAPLFGKRAARLERAAEAVQTSLGLHRDTLLTRQTLRQLGVQAHLDGDNGFTFGRLHALEEVAARAALADYEQQRDRLGRDKLVGWLG